MHKTFSILGSTGSIGTQSLEVARKLKFTVSALTANSNIKLLEEQIREFCPKIAAVVDEKAASELKIKVKDTNTKVLSGLEGVCEAAALEETDIVLNAIVGISGLLPTMEAIKAKKDIALANKETLVTGGKLVMNAAKENGVKILPVDSEHSAIFQCLQGKPSNGALKGIILTASGGPFFGKSKDDLKSVTVKEALNHPNWSMGAKITVDSATMMNKGLEIIEAVHLFNMPPEKIDVVIHRESIIHSLIEFDDNSVIAQLGLPDMKIPIQYALTCPERYPSPAGRLNLAKVCNLSFYEPDYETFLCLKTCREAIEKGGLAPAAVNGANEQAVDLFLKGKLGFLQIGELVYDALQNQSQTDQFTLDDVLNTDKAARERVLSKVKL